jgi:hypothetical protein
VPRPAMARRAGRLGNGRAQEHPATSRRRSARPASHRIFTWRDTRGWLCPSTCANSPTASSMLARSRMMRRRVGSARARKDRAGSS